MSKHNQNIEELFKQKLADREADYNPSELESVWINVEEQVGASGNAGGESSSGASSAGDAGLKGLISGTKGWIVTSVAAVAALGGSVYFFSQPDSEQNKTKNQNAEETVINESKGDKDKEQSPSVVKPFEQPDNPSKGEPGTADFEDGKSTGKSGNVQENKNDLAGTASSDKGGQKANGTSPATEINQSDEDQADKGGQSAPSEKIEKAVSHFPAVFFQKDFMNDDQAGGSRPVILLQKQVICQGAGLLIKTMNFDDHHKAWYQLEGGNYRELTDRAKVQFEEIGKQSIDFRMEKDGKTREESILVRVAPIPSAEFDYENVGYQKVRFRNSSTDAGQFHWNFGDGKNSGQKQPIHYYERPGQKQVMLKASNEYQCTDSMTQTLNIAPFPKPEIPNTITPNGDGKNDEFRIKIKDEVYYYLVIRNEEGQKVFESTSKQRRWDGTHHNGGKACKSGTYHYTFEYRYKGQKEKTNKSGRIYLKRE